MAENYPGPYQLRLFYTVDADGEGPMDHVLALNLDCSGDPLPGELFPAISVIARVVGDHPLDTVTDEIVALLRPLHSLADATIVHAELWHFDALSYDAHFHSTYAINLAGSSANPGTPAASHIYTFRTHEGNIMKVYVQESIQEPGASLTYAELNAATQAFVDYFTGDNDSFFLARDTSYPLAFLKMHPGQSEKLFKARFR